jgi:hypothetical protein
MPQSPAMYEGIAGQARNDIAYCVIASVSEAISKFRQSKIICKDIQIFKKFYLPLHPFSKTPLHSPPYG